jgi:glycosyltransferase involved in cell wall biosynthesis
MVVFTGNPYVAIAFNKLYKNFWRQEVDQIVVGVNDSNQEVVDFIAGLWHGDCKAVVWKDYKNHGQGGTFNNIYPLCNGEVVATMDSDNWVIQKGIVSHYIDEILNNKADAIGSFGYCCDHPKLRDQYVKKYGTVRLNPFMSFWRKSFIEKAGRPNFGMRICKYTDGKLLQAEKNDLADRSKLYKLDEMAYFSISVFEANDLMKIKKIPPGDKGYFHIGGLSNVSRFYIPDEKKRLHMGLHRCAFLNLIYQTGQNECLIPNYNKKYLESLNNAIQACKFKHSDLNSYIKNFEKNCGIGPLAVILS